MPEDLLALPTDWSRALAVVAHPDDLEFGAAGAVAAWTAAGKTVAYLLVTRGEAGIDAMAPAEAAAVREAEQRDSAAVVGVTDVEFLDHPDGTVEYGVPLRRDITAAIRRHRPELIVTFNHHDRWASGKLNSPDHRHTGQAVLDAAGDAGNRWVFPDLGPEPWGGVRYVAVAGSPVPSHAVDITGTMDLAVASLQAHRAYLEGLGPTMSDVRGPLTAMAEANGARFGGRLSLAFELLSR
ncbi:PIG-L deacetylase family protein [Micromonospora tulbaghiae]|uniref:N-acetylglucosaminyl deacetylase, LmbE family n=1 Tax=Micromonospora tulbaghiae TaxID=479978 RepID=A0ABY0KHI2_9ACTN|nr:PIG-L deacetylase family protein [Micromonospora tulbaghiae]MDX5459238.1 PIG-L family deacetylase [Micromonospora tulbaghiae]SCE73612.1 N-acetylglucosaminyl deacetylase, LmbE family [Micromonospora tulbaghiae]